VNSDVDRTKKSTLVIARHSPYGTGLARASLDLVLAGAAFEQDIAMLFLGDGVLQLLPDQDARQVGRKSIAKQLASLPLYDVESVYADAQAAAQHGIDLSASPVPAKPLNTDETRELIASFEHVLGF